MMPDDAAQASGKCPKCKGIGAESNNSAAIPCSDCEGTGRLSAVGECSCRRSLEIYGEHSDDCDLRNAPSGCICGLSIALSTPCRCEQLRADFTEALKIIKGLFRIATSAPYSAVHGDEEWIERAALLVHKHQSKERT